jgi:Raf kinase inhibitor-like YbhB/YbcL family protein
MRRRGLTCLTVALAVTGFTACDTNDGREMEPPSSYARFQLQNTAPSTAPTTAAPPTELTVPTTLATTTVPTTSAPLSTDAGASVPGIDEGTDASAAAALGVPDLAAQGLVVTAPWEPGGAIDPAFTCEGAGDAPLITWTAPPEGTAELAFAVVDETADGFVHWLVIGLPAEAGSLGGGEPLVVGSEAINDFAYPGWGGPCPPAGSGPHTYRFTLYALSQALGLTTDTPATDLLAAIEAAAVGAATLTGIYEIA